jgi:hypothetical protein
MPFQAILREVDHLHNVSTRLEALAEKHPPLSEPLITVAGTVRNTNSRGCVRETSLAPGV